MKVRGLRYAEPRGRNAGMLAGFVVTVVWVQWFKAGFYDLYEMIPGFLAGLVCIRLLYKKPKARRRR